MNLRMIQRLVGLALFGFGLFLIIPLGVSNLMADGAAGAFRTSLLWITTAGFLIWFPVRRKRRDLRLRDGFLLITLFWALIGLVGALPLYLFQPLNLDLSSAVFESVSGLTTTGATILVGLDGLPPSILMYRHLLQWLGGMGVIVIAVAVLPVLGIGGMAHYRADTPGPIKDSRLTPRIRETVRALWGIYVGLTAACALAYWAAGMSGLEALGHAFSTISTGGFSSHDASLAHFDDVWIELVAVVFMLAGGLNFALHFGAFRGKDPGTYVRDPEFRLFFKIFVGVVFLCSAYLAMSVDTVAYSEAFRHSLFQVAAVLTNTGFMVADLSLWPAFLPALLMFLSMVGGCAGSTSGGMKVIRIYMIFKQLRWEVLSLVHPAAVPTVKVGGRVVENHVVRAVWGFFVAYVVMYGILMVMLIATGLDDVTAFSAVAATINNLGHGLGAVSQDFTVLGEAGRWICIYAMILGRLEIFTLLVLFTPAFWRH